MDSHIFIIKSYFDAASDPAAAGKAVSDDARPIIENGGQIIFDMTGQEAVSTVFLNTSFGFLMEIFGVEKVKQSFRFKNILKSQAERISKYFSYFQSVTA